jgi:hypothetical protein
METLGINTGLLLIQLIPLVLLIGLPVISLLDLRRKNLSGTALAVWVLVICAVPFIGSLAYWIIKPSAEMK